MYIAIRSATRSSYAQAGYGGAGAAVHPGTPPGDTIPVTIDPFKVEDGVP